MTLFQRIEWRLFKELRRLRELVASGDLVLKEETKCLSE